MCSEMLTDSFYRDVRGCGDFKNKKLACRIADAKSAESFANLELLSTLRQHDGRPMIEVAVTHIVVWT